MTDEELMRIAIQEASKSTESLKCGVVIAKDGQAVTKGFNQQHNHHNATAHAEILTISEAGKILGNKNLTGCIIYCTCEPCTMCLSAIVYAKLEKLFYGLSLSEVSPQSKRIDISIDDFLSKSPNKPVVIKNFLKAECEDLIK